MATRITWAPGDELADFYEVKVADSPTSTFSLLGTLVGDLTGNNYNKKSGKFFYDDPTGEDTSVYRIQGFLEGGLVLDTGIIQPEVSKTVATQYRVRVDQDFQEPNNLRYTTTNGQPIVDATVRVFTQPDWEAGRRTVSLFVTKTDSLGNWNSPFWLEPGLTYVVVYEKQGLYGPDTKTIVV